MRQEQKKHLHIWVISFLSFAFFSVVANVWFNDVRVAEVPWHARAAYKLLGTLWPLLILGITSVLFGFLSFWRRGLWGLFSMILIALLIWGAQGYVLSFLIGNALLQSEPKNAEFYYLLRVLVISKNTLLFSLFIFSIALWLSETIRVKIAGRSYNGAGGSI